MAGQPESTRVRVDKLSSLLAFLAAAVSSLLVITGLLLIGSYFYNTVALLGVCLVMAYILAGPVSALDHTLEWFIDKTKHLNFLPMSLTNKLPIIHTRLISILLVYCSFILISAMGLNWLGPLLYEEVKAFSKDVPSYVEQAEDFVFEWSNQTFGTNVLKDIFASDIKKVASAPSIQKESFSEVERQVIQDSVSKRLLDQLGRFLTQVLSSTVNNATDLLTGTLTGLVYFFTGTLLTFYFLRDGKKLKFSFLWLLPPNIRPTGEYFLERTHHVMLAFIKGQVLLGILTGFYMFIIYSLFHVKYAIFLGSFFAISEILPVIGTWIGITPGIIVMLFSEDPWTLLWVWLCSYGFQTLKDNIIAPKVVGDVMGLHPLVIILSLLICAKLAGIVGILLALPLASFINVVIRFISHGKEAEYSTVQSSSSGN